MTIPLVISIISLSLCVAGFFFLRWYISRRTAASQLLEEYRDEVDRLIAGIHAAADKNLLLMEDKIKTLKKLMEDTDKRISVYTREIQRSRNSEAIYKNLGRGIREALESIPASTAGQAPTEGPASPAGSAPTEGTAPVAESAPTEGSAPAAESTSPAEPASKRSKIQTPAEINELPFSDEEKGTHHVNGGKKQKKRKTAKKPSAAAHPDKPGIKMQIAQMAIQGLSPTQIASKLGISSAEVDLALNLLNLPGKEEL